MIYIYTPWKQKEEGEGEGEGGYHRILSGGAPVNENVFELSFN